MEWLKVEKCDCPFLLLSSSLNNAILRQIGEIDDWLKYWIEFYFTWSPLTSERAGILVTSDNMVTRKGRNDVHMIRIDTNRCSCVPVCGSVFFQHVNRWDDGVPGIWESLWWVQLLNYFMLQLPSPTSHLHLPKRGWSEECQRKQWARWTWSSLPPPSILNNLPYNY